MAYQQIYTDLHCWKFSYSTGVVAKPAWEVVFLLTHATALSWELSWSTLVVHMDSLLTGCLILQGLFAQSSLRRIAL